MWRTVESEVGRIVVPPRIPDGFAVFATTRDFDGRLTADEAQRIAAVIRGMFGVSASLRTCNQVHGVGVERVSAVKGWAECDSCDALWSDEREVALGIKVADCLPVTMIDPVHSIIANAHSGWRGAVQQITSVVLDSLERSTRFSAADSLAYLGPSIRSCCFEVGEEVAAQFDERFVERRRAKPHVDLVAHTTALLERRGFASDRVFDSGFCTRCDGSIFHSYRRDGSSRGRNLEIVAQ